MDSHEGWSRIAAVLARGQDLMRSGDSFADDRLVSLELGTLQLDALVLGDCQVAQLADYPATVRDCVVSAAAVLAGMDDSAVTPDSADTINRLADLLDYVAPC